MISIFLPWKEKKVNLNIVNQKLKQYENYCGLSAGKELIVHFDSMLISEEVETEIKTYWESLEDSSDEIISYKSFEEELTLKMSKKESAKNKLKSLGLDAEEIAALIGD